jgi:hypothetical protein
MGRDPLTMRLGHPRCIWVTLPASLPSREVSQNEAEAPTNGFAVWVSHSLFGSAAFFGFPNVGDSNQTRAGHVPRAAP